MRIIVPAFALASLLIIGNAGAGDWTWNPPAKSKIPIDPPILGSCLSYDYIDLEYISTDFGTPYYNNSDAWGIGFSKSLGSTFYVNGSFAEGDYDFDWVNHTVGVETRRYRIGVGAHREIARCVDLTFDGGAEYTNAKYPYYEDHNYDSWTYYFGPGLRARAGRFEYFAKALYFTSEGDYSQEYLSHQSGYHGRINDYGWVFTPGVVLHVTEHLGVKFAAEFGQYDTDYVAGIRYEF